MHVLVHIQGDGAKDTRDVLDEPEHKGVAPPGRVGVGSSLVRARANLAQRSLDEVARVGDQQAGAADLAHGSGDEVAENKLDIDIVASQLRSQSAAPVLQEGLATRVRGEVRRGRPAGKRAHGEDESLATLLQDGRHDLSDLQRAQTVDCDDSLQLLLGRLEERYGHVVALSDVVEEDAHVEVGDEAAEAHVVGGVVLGEVHGEGLGLHTAVLALDFGGEDVELGEGTGDEDEVEALGGELGRKLLAQAVRGAGYDGPCAGLAILAKLSDSQ